MRRLRSTASRRAAPGAAASRATDRKSYTTLFRSEENVLAQIEREQLPRRGEPLVHAASPFNSFATRCAWRRGISSNRSEELHDALPIGGEGARPNRGGATATPRRAARSCGVSVQQLRDALRLAPRHLEQRAHAVVGMLLELARRSVGHDRTGMHHDDAIR